jgi:hypothetical protein
LSFAALSLSAATPRPSSITTRAASPSLLLAAVGNIAGGNGTHFRTDVTLVNHRAEAQRVALLFIKRDVNNSAATPLFIDLPAHSVLFYPDFVGEQLKLEGFGALRIRAVTASGGNDVDGKLDAFARIWTLQPGTTGSVSQAFYAQREEDLHGNAANSAYVIGLTHDERFRTNVAIVNLDGSAAQSYTIRVVGTNGSTTFQMSLLPLSFSQVALPAGVYGELYLVITPDTGIIDPSGESTYAAYGSTVDNVTGDSWSVSATLGFGAQ